MSQLTKNQTNEIINIIYLELKTRHINPTGTFDKSGRWYAEHKDLINVRTPSRAYSYSQLIACRSKKYVTRV